MNRDLVLAHVPPGWLGRTLEVHRSLPSTNDRARQLLDDQGPSAHGAVVFADRQTGARGRHGRTWLSPEGLGIACSVALWPEAPAERTSCLPLAGSLAVVRALEEVTGADAKLKWPNDVLLGNRKVAGVLVEARRHGDEPAGLVMGIGINLFHRAEDFPPELRASATSVALATGRRPDPETVSAALLRHLSPLLVLAFADPAALVAQADGRWCHERGDLLDISVGTAALRGAFVEVGPDGALWVEVDGTRRPVHHGEVLRVRSVDGGER